MPQTSCYTITYFDADTLKPLTIVFDDLVRAMRAAEAIFAERGLVVAIVTEVPQA